MSPQRIIDIFRIDFVPFGNFCQQDKGIFIIRVIRSKRKQLSLGQLERFSIALFEHTFRLTEQLNILVVGKKQTHGEHDTGQ